MPAARSTVTIPLASVVYFVPSRDPAEILEATEPLSEMLISIDTLPEYYSDIVKEVYDDGARPMVKSIGGIFGTLFGFVDNVILYPMKKLNTIFVYVNKMIV